MNYEKIYNNIIEKRKLEPLDENVYGEIHHILPRSLGGSNKKRNLVRLSAREHFICHALLAEMYKEGTTEWYKMNHAFKMMFIENENQTRYMNSRLYELKRKDFSKMIIELQSGKKRPEISGENHYLYGKPRSEETKQKIRESNLGKIITEETKQKQSEARIGKIPWNKGKKTSEETKRKQSEAKKGENNYWFGKELTEDHKRNISEAHLGLNHTEETKQKIREAKLKPILQFSKKGALIKQWNSIKDAATELSINKGNISSACTGRYKSAGGFVWKYK